MDSPCKGDYAGSNPVVGLMSVTLDYGLERFCTREPLTLKEEKRAARKMRYKKNRQRRIREMYESFPNCYYCGEWLHKNNRSLDHVVPQSRGGRSCFSNLVTACRECNQKKGNSMPETWSSGILMGGSSIGGTRGKS